MRVTRKHLEGVFERFKRNMNLDDSFQLQRYNAGYGAGYIIVQVDELGGEHHWFGNFKRDINEMYKSLVLANDALEYLKLKGDE